MAFRHYQLQTAIMVDALANNQVKVPSESTQPAFVASDNAQDFIMVKAHGFTR